MTMASHEIESLGQEYATAYKTVRRVRTLLLTIVLLGILVTAGSAVLAIFGGVLDQPAPAAGVSEADTPATALATAPATAAATAPADKAAITCPWTSHQPMAGDMLTAALSVCLVVTPAAAVLTVFAMLMTVNLVFLGRTGGVPSFITAFFWTWVLVGVLMPWQVVAPHMRLPGATFGAGELMAAVRCLGAEPSWMDRVCVYKRFVACPLVALFVWVIIVLKCRCGNRRLQESLLAPAEPTTITPEMLGGQTAQRPAPEAPSTENGE
jgi:hypothetical protein